MVALSNCANFGQIVSYVPIGPHIEPICSLIQVHHQQRYLDESVLLSTLRASIVVQRCVSLSPISIRRPSRALPHGAAVSTPMTTCSRVLSWSSSATCELVSAASGSKRAREAASSSPSSWSQEPRGQPLLRPMLRRRHGCISASHAASSLGQCAEEPLPSGTIRAFRLMATSCLAL